MKVKDKIDAMNRQVSKWAGLLTEQRNSNSTHIDRCSTVDALRLINAEDQKVARAVEGVIDDVARAVDLVVSAFLKGGRLFYVGAGTSGRLGVLDASECPPTYGVSPGLVQGIIAGGIPALTRSQEGAEDHSEDGKAALKDRGCTSDDVVMGIAASGVTPFVLGALEYAQCIGAKTLFFTCNPDVVRKVRADVAIVPVVGPEVIAGSTRMKAGTATKLVLNMITTTAMIRLGKVYENLMVDLAPTCDKLIDRAERILGIVCDMTPEEGRRALDNAQGDLKTAIVMTKRAVSIETARELLRQNGGVINEVLLD